MRQHRQRSEVEIAARGERVKASEAEVEEKSWKIVWNSVVWASWSGGWSTRWGKGEVWRAGGSSACAACTEADKVEDEQKEIFTVLFERKAVEDCNLAVGACSSRGRWTAGGPTDSAGSDDARDVASGSVGGGRGAPTWRRLAT